MRVLLCVCLSSLLAAVGGAGEAVALEAMVVDLHAPHYHYEIIKKLVQVSLDGTAYDRETASDHITQLQRSGRVRCESSLPCPPSLPLSLSIAHGPQHPPSPAATHK